MISACDECSGNGGWYTAKNGDRHLSDPYAEMNNWQKCQTCDGTGLVGDPPKYPKFVVLNSKGHPRLETDDPHEVAIDAWGRDARENPIYIRLDGLPNEVGKLEKALRGLIGASDDDQNQNDRDEADQEEAT